MKKEDTVFQKGDIVSYNTYVKNERKYAIVIKPNYSYRPITETGILELDKMGIDERVRKLGIVAFNKYSLVYTQSTLKNKFGFDFQDIDMYVKAGFVLADSYSAQGNGELFLKRYFWTDSKNGKMAMAELQKIKDKYDNRLWAYGIDPETQEELHYESDGIQLGKRHNVKVVSKDKKVTFQEINSDFFCKANLIESYKQIETGISLFKKMKSEAIEKIKSHGMRNDKFISREIHNEFLMDEIKNELLEYIKANDTPDKKALNLYIEFKECIIKALKG
jgi:hypothetical protein